MTDFDDALAAVGTLVSMHIESGGAFVQPDADVVEQARAALPVLRAEHDDTRRYLRGCEQWFYPNDTPNKDMAKAVASNYLKLRAEHERVAAERDEFNGIKAAGIEERVTLRAALVAAGEENARLFAYALEAAALKAESLDWTDPTEPDEGWLTDYIRTRVHRRSAAAIREVAAEHREEK